MEVRFECPSSDLRSSPSSASRSGVGPIIGGSTDGGGWTTPGSEPTRTRRQPRTGARLTGYMRTVDYPEPAVPLGDARMPLLGFGTWQISNAAAPQATSMALEAGYRHIDTATGYQNEQGIGRALAATSLPRESLFLTTKMPPENVGRERRILEESLTKLGVDHVDLWLVHWPPNGQATPRAWEQFIQAQQDG